MKTTTLLLLSAALALGACSTNETVRTASNSSTEVKRYEMGGVTLSSDVADRRYPLHGGKFGK